MAVTGNLCIPESLMSQILDEVQGRCTFIAWNESTDRHSLDFD
jgi:hypothetical protein